MARPFFNKRKRNFNFNVDDQRVEGAQSNVLATPLIDVLRNNNENRM